MRCVAILGLTILLTGCIEDTKVVTTGMYGPFEIGEPKVVALSNTERIVQLREIDPTASADDLEDPSSDSIHRFDGSNGVLLFVDHHPFPIRVEFKDDRVVEIENQLSECRASKESMNVACRELNGLGRVIAVGMSRLEVYRSILEYRTQLSKQIGAFVPGFDFEPGAVRSTNEHRAFLLENDAWKFDGLSELSPYDSPFYSQVTLCFESGRLVRIKHWSAPYELP